MRPSENRLSPKAFSYLVALVKEHGVNGAARIVGLSRHSVAALVSPHARKHAGTVALGESKIAAVRAAQPPHAA